MTDRRTDGQTETRQQLVSALVSVARVKFPGNVHRHRRHEAQLSQRDHEGRYVSWKIVNGCI